MAFDINTTASGPFTAFTNCTNYTSFANFTSSTNLPTFSTSHHAAHHHLTAQCTRSVIYTCLFWEKANILKLQSIIYVAHSTRCAADAENRSWVLILHTWSGIIVYSWSHGILHPLRNFGSKSLWTVKPLSLTVSIGLHFAASQRVNRRVY